MANEYFLANLFKKLFRGQLVHCDSYEEAQILRSMYDAARIPHKRTKIYFNDIFSLNMSDYEIAQFKHICNVETFLKNPEKAYKDWGVRAENVLYPSQIEAKFREYINTNLDHYDIMCILAPLIEDNTRSIGALVRAFTEHKKEYNKRISFVEYTINKYKPTPGINCSSSSTMQSKGPQW